MQEFTGDPEDRKAFKAWRKKRGDAAARLDKRRQTWERTRKAQVKERARVEDERIQVWRCEIEPVQQQSSIICSLHGSGQAGSARARPGSRSEPERRMSIQVSRVQSAQGCFELGSGVSRQRAQGKGGG